MGELITLCAKTGIEIFLVAALVWMHWYVIKNTVIKQGEMITKLGDMINKLLDSLNRLSERIEKHEQQADMRGMFVKKEHEQMIILLEKMNESK